MLRRLQKSFNWLLPSSCLLCHALSESSQALCAACASDLPRLTVSCIQCAKPLVTTAPIRCGECLQHPPAFTVTHALFAYQPPITKWIMELKFHHCLANAALLGDLFASHLVAGEHYIKTRPNVILPLPLHPTRQRERGFNQALEIARPISRRLGIPIAPLACIRHKATAAQAQLPASERQKNIKNAFKIKQNLQGLHVAIVDDVITTGYTVQAFSQALIMAGATQVDVWAIARATL